MATPTSPTGARPRYAKLVRRLAIAVGVLFVCVVPAAVLYAITGEAAATWATVAGIVGVSAVISGGREVAIFTSIVTGIIAPVAIVAGSVPIAGAALMSLMCLTVGYMARFGLHRATLLVPVFMAWLIIDPPFWGPQHLVVRTDETYLAWMCLIFLVGALVPALVMVVALRKVRMPTPKPHPRRATIPYSATITVLTTVATFWVLQHPKQIAGAWLISTILVLAQVGDVGTVTRTIQRVVGTLLGMLIVAVIVVEVKSLVVLYVIGLVLGIAALTAKFSPRYWIYMALITPTAVCLGAASSNQVRTLGDQRLIDTLVGAGLVLLAAGLTIGYAHLAKRLGIAPTDSSDVVA